MGEAKIPAVCVKVSAKMSLGLVPLPVACLASGSRVRRGHTPATLLRGGFLFCTKQKLLSFLEGADLLRDWKEAAAGRQNTTTFNNFCFSA